MLFCERNADGRSPAKEGSPYFRASVAHEFSHCLLRRYLGNVDIPTWINEGLAMHCGAFMSPDYRAETTPRWQSASPNARCSRC